MAFLSPTFIYLCQRFVKTVSHNVFKLLYIYFYYYFIPNNRQKKNQQILTLQKLEQQIL